MHTRSEYHKTGYLRYFNPQRTDNSNLVHVMITLFNCLTVLTSKAVIR